MTAGLPRRLGVVGLGLMGASLARAARAALPEVQVIAVEPREDVRAKALADGVADLALAEPGRSWAPASWPSCARPSPRSRRSSGRCRGSSRTAPC